MSLFRYGNIHQGHESFSSLSRGRQCSFMSLSALLNVQSVPLLEWNSTVIDKILLQGDIMYLKAIQNRQIPQQEYPSLDDMPNIVQYYSVTNNFFGPIEAQTIIDEPIEAQSIDLPIVVEPIEAQHINLPIVVEPIEAQNESQTWYINYGKECQGLIINEHEVEALYVSL